MKKQIILISLFILSLCSIRGQAYSEDFESYTASDYLGIVSPYWTTWSGRTGGSEDIQINDSNANSGKNSLFYDSPRGGGPQNIVMPFHHTLKSGKFKFSSMFFVPSGNNASFNFQGDSILGTSTSMEFFMFDNGTFDVNGLTGGYPMDRWFELRIEVDFDINNWLVYVDNRFQGTFSSNVNSIRHFNLFGINPNSSFWMDDVNYCIQYACNPDIVMNKLEISPDPLCSNHSANVSLSLSNNGPQPATGFELAIKMKGQASIRHMIVLDSLKVGRDTIIVIPNLFKTHITGKGLELMAINNDHDLNTMNDTMTTSIDVYPSPYGSGLTKGNTFQGSLRKGTLADPDLLENGKTNAYFLTPPAMYQNSDYNIDWKINSIIARTPFGVIIPGSRYQFNYPSNAGNGSLQITGQDGYVDSTITFFLTLQNMNNGCDTLVQRSIRIVPVPNIQFVVPDTVCVGNIVAFENKSSIHSGQTTTMWYFGDNDSSDYTNTKHIYYQAGAYQVKLVLRSFPYGFLKDTSMTIQVTEKPVVKFSAKNQCQGEPILFNNLSSVSNGTLQYLWDFGDSSSKVNAVNPQYTYSTAGMRKVVLTASANGCAASFTKNVFQFPIPVADFTVPTTGLCADAEINLSNQTTILSGNHHALWDFGDSNTSTLFDGKHSYSKSGNYVVKLKSVSDFGCQDSISKTITILSTPVASFKADRFCDGMLTTLTNTSTKKSLPTTIYKWELSDGSTSFQYVFKHKWPGTGTYTIKLSAKSINGCGSSITEEIKVLPQPVADFKVEDICLGEIATFENISKNEEGDIQYLWDFGNNSSSSDPNPSAKYDVPDLYPVSLIATYDHGCSDTMTRTIAVNDTPVCNFNYINQGNMRFTFIPDDTMYSQYEWFFGDGGYTTDNTPEYSYVSGGSYKVKMKATNAAGCSCESSKIISSSSSVNTINNIHGIQIYPNPSAGIIIIKNTEAHTMKVEVFNVLGTKIYDESSDNGTLTADLSKQAQGIYFVKVSINGVDYTTKITITH